MDNRIDTIIYQLEDNQEELRDLERIDRVSLLERIADIRTVAEELLNAIEDIEIGDN